MTAHSVLNVRAAPEWGNSELYKYYERNGLGYGTVQEAGQLARMCRYATGSEAYREKHRCYLLLVGRVTALEEERLALSDPVTGEDSESKVEVVGGLNVCLAQAMSHYQWEE